MLNATNHSKCLAAPVMAPEAIHRRLWEISAQAQRDPSVSIAYIERHVIDQNELAAAQRLANELGVRVIY